MLDHAVQALRGLESVRFTLTHEAGGTDLGSGLTLTTVLGEADFPDKAKMEAKAVLTEFKVNVEIGILQVESLAFLRDPISAQWRQVEPASLPFLFADMNGAVAEALAAAQEIALVGSGELDGALVYRLEALVPAEALARLVPSSASGELLQVVAHVGQTDGLPRRIRMEGRLLARDPPGMVRVLSLSQFNATVTIEPPL